MPISRLLQRRQIGGVLWVMPSDQRHPVVHALTALLTQVTKEEYVRVGSVALGQQLLQQLQKQGLNPAVIPVGGSNSLGTWGYLDAAQELASQDAKFTDIVMVSRSACTGLSAMARQPTHAGWL